MLIIRSNFFCIYNYQQGVKFQSPHDGTEMLLTPEESMRVQNAIGADIMMALDDVVHTLVTGPRVEVCAVPSPPQRPLDHVHYI